MNPNRPETIHHRRRRLTTADLLFARLDRQRIRGQAAIWMTEILGIFVEAGEAWIQVARAGQPSTSVLLRMPQRGSVRRALAALKTWTDFPLDGRPAVLDVRG